MPDPDLQHPDADLLLHAYRHGVFPMVDHVTGVMEWFSPDPRALLPLDDRFHVPRSLARIVRQDRFEIRSDTSFAEVMRACSVRPDDPSWIDERLVTAYAQLHARGHAHTMEAWLDGQLVGGLYGVHIGAAFFGESMFVQPDLGGANSSKVCLVRLVEHLRRQGFLLLDTQFTNEHIEQFGCEEIGRGDYVARLAVAVETEADWGWAGG